MKRKYIKCSNYLIFVLVALLFYLILNAPLFVKECFCAEERLDFYDFVNEAELKEASVNNSENKASPGISFIEKNSRMRLQGQLISFTLTIVGIGVLYITKNKYTSTHKLKTEEVLKIGAEEILAAINPIEASAVINIGSFSKYDIITVFFELIRKKILVIEDLSCIDVYKAKIYINKDKLDSNMSDLQNYEDFLIGWFITKIGKGEYFSFKRLNEYLSMDSRAAEFDIDYDIWNDELREVTSFRKIYDPSTEKWKNLCSLFCIFYAVAGLFLLYTTNSMVSMLMFITSFLLHRLPRDAVRRSIQAELDYQRLMLAKDYIEFSTEETTERNKNKEKWDRYFIYCIPFSNTEIFLEKYEEYRELYNMFESELEKAIIFANNIISSSKVY